MDYRRLNQLSAAIMLIAGVLAMLMPVAFVESLLASSQEANGEMCGPTCGPALELGAVITRIAGAIFIGCGFTVAFLFLDLEQPKFQKKALACQAVISLGILTASIHGIMSTEATLAPKILCGITLLFLILFGLTYRKINAASE